MFNKILIANRGEIACRIIRTARRMGIETVAIYSTADRNSLHVSLADSAFCVGQPAASASYLNIDGIIAVAQACKAEAIHPGYGFLSENPTMAEACAKAGIVFIGPSVNALKIMGSKQLAKQALENTGVPLTPGYHGQDQTDQHLLAEAEKLGYPVLLKAANGGGGKGMRVVNQATEFTQALAAARRESKAYFGDDTMLIEKLMVNPRHVELQIMADNHGQVVHLFERDCSIQRRHQKIIEEAPAPNLPPTLRIAMSEAAIDVARAIDYRGAGTVEFLVTQEGQFYFMEMNTRLQVEHPVTEMITGFDLVEWQFKIAANDTLPKNQVQVHAHGHAMECRIYAEDPQHDFMPSIGKINYLEAPAGEGIRIDSGVISGSDISMHYDPMIAKLITWGENRQEACQRMQHALRHYHIGGVKTNIPFLQAVFAHPKFLNAELGTGFLEQETITLATPDIRQITAMAACFDFLFSLNSTDALLQDTFDWRMNLKNYRDSRYTIDDNTCSIRLRPISAGHVTLETDNETLNWQIRLDASILSIDDGRQQWHCKVQHQGDSLTFYIDTGPVTVERYNAEHGTADNPASSGQLTAPMPATVVAILKKAGDRIKSGDCLMVLEAMKMEHTIHAPADGLLKDIYYDIGAQVSEGAQLVALEIDKP